MTKQQIEREALKLWVVLHGRVNRIEFYRENPMMKKAWLKLARHVLRRVESARLEGKHDAMKADEPNHFDVA